MRAYMAQGLLLSKKLEIMEKLHTSKTFSKMAGGRMHIPHLPSWIRPWPKATKIIK